MGSLLKAVVIVLGIYFIDIRPTVSVIQLVASADCAGALDVTDDLQHLLVTLTFLKLYISLICSAFVIKMDLQKFNSLFDWVTTVCDLLTSKFKKCQKKQKLLFLQFFLTCGCLGVLHKQGEHKWPK